MGSACGGCAANRAKNTEQWVWRSEDGQHTTIYTGKYAKTQAEYKAERKGGTFVIRAESGI